MAVDVLKYEDKDSALTETNLAMAEALYFTAIKVQPAQIRSTSACNSSSCSKRLLNRKPFLNATNHVHGFGITQLETRLMICILCMIWAEKGA